MNKATRITAAAFGVSAGIASIEHGYFEILQGDARPEGLMIVSMGPPCQPAQIWNSCEPAMTIIPNFFITGILAVLLGALMILWCVFFLPRRGGPLGLFLISIGLLLFGGGLFPPLIGFIASALSTRIHKPLVWTRARLGGQRGLARLYPLALIAYLALVFGQFIIGHFFNEFLMRYMGLNVLIILGLLALSYLSALIHDSREAAIAPETATPTYAGDTGAG